MVCVRIFYPADPAGVVPGGVDTFLRGIIKYAPDDIKIDLVGMTTDINSRPLGVWSECSVDGRAFRFFPVVAVRSSAERSKIPLSVRYIWGLFRFYSESRPEFDVFEFHRVEPGFLFLRDSRPKNAFFHQDMGVIRNNKSDILWSYLPKLYFWVESTIVASLSSLWCVREEGVLAMRQRYPEKSRNINFIPTWVDVKKFYPSKKSDLVSGRQSIAVSLGLPVEKKWIVTVGRLDKQKDPQLMLDGFKLLLESGRDAVWLVVGDGVLRTSLEQAVHNAGMTGRVFFLGLMPQDEIAALLRVSDVYALSSAYEGMPMALLEAMGSGLPVVSTDVGEVKRVLFDGKNGVLCHTHDVKDFGLALIRGFDLSVNFDSTKSTSAIQLFTPDTVLGRIFDNYRRLASEK